MDLEIKKILDKQTELLEENNSVIKKVRRAQVVGTTIGILKWVIVIGAAFGAYYYFQPVILRLFELYDSLFSGLPGIPDLLNAFKDGQ